MKTTILRHITLLSSALVFLTFFSFAFISSQSCMAAFQTDSTCSNTLEAAQNEDVSWNVRYAVSLYGIEQDLYEGGGTRKAGLTFGPATGACYIQSYTAHVTEEEYRKDPVENLCLHWMSWEEIAAQSREDPSVFRPCLENRCTHAVEICLNSTLKQRDYSGMTGDGACGLLSSLKPGFRSWNSGRSYLGGWPASRMRATLNGADWYSDVSVIGEEYMLSADDCLFSCFPPELQQLIVAKAVISDLDYDRKEGNCAITYDRLWLFSAYEIHGNIAHAKESEGPQYQRNALRPCEAGTLPPDYQMYSERGNTIWAWLRSSSYLIDVMNFHIFGGGHVVDGMFYNYFAVAPGFCLP